MHYFFHIKEALEVLSGESFMLYVEKGVVSLQLANIS